MSFSKLDYCQFLLSSQVNYTLTHLADHLGKFSHDTINRYLNGEHLNPALLWENVQPLLEQDAQAFVIFDDTVIDKSFGRHIEMVRRQWSGNAHGIIRGIGLVSCVYVHPQSGNFWVLDYRLFDPEGDGKTKLDHVEEMVASLTARQVLYQTVLMDTWYATTDLMLRLDELGKTFYCPLKSNRQVDDSGGERPYQAVSLLSWTEVDQASGKLIKVKGFPSAYKVKLFRVSVSTHRTDFIVTNDLSQASTEGARQVCGVRWKIEQFHREVKQLTGLESCQCRKARIQRNHVACALLVWTRLKSLAYQSQREAMSQTVYQLKRGMWSDYLIQQLKKPTIQMKLA